MQFPIRDVAAGVVSGVVTCFVSVYALACTTAIAMPSGVPLVLWQAMVTFGLGVFLVTFVLHASVLWATRAEWLVAFVAFVVAVVGTLAVISTLFMATKIIVAWLLGALLASVVVGWFRSGRSSKATERKNLQTV